MINQPRIKTVFISTLLFSMLVCTFFSERSLAFVVSKTESTGAEIKWQIPSETYYVNASGGPSGSLSAVQAALQTWTEVPSSSFVFLYGGLTEKVCYDVNLDPDHERGTDDDPGDYGLNDGLNIICFGPMGVNGTLAENTFWFYSSGQLVDSDIQLNTSYPYATDGSASSYDVQSLATHESGHSLSLGDLYGASDVEKTMYGYGTKGDISKRTLHQDDIDGIAYLYFSITGTATSVTSASARLSGSVNPNGSATNYLFQYGTTTAYGSSTSSLSAGSGTGFVTVYSDIAGLSAGTLYHFRIVASKATRIAYGEDMTLITQGPPEAKTSPATAIKFSSASGVTSSSAHLNATVNPYGINTSYYFEYGLTPYFGLITPSAQAGDGYAEVQVSTLVTGLNPKSTYYFRISATNAEGSSYGETMTFSTMKPRPMPWLRLLLLDEEQTGVVPTSPDPNDVPPR